MIARGCVAWLGAVVICGVVVCGCSEVHESRSDESVVDTEGAHGAVTAILGAFGREVMMFEDEMIGTQELRIEGLRFVKGRLSGRDVVVAYTGGGKVNAAMTTTLTLEHFEPDEVIFTGIAGGVDPNLFPGDIVIAERTAHHDMGTVWPEGFFPRGVKNPLDGWENPVVFEADPNLLELAKKAAGNVSFRALETPEGQRLPSIRTGTIVTGDVFVASEAKCEELREKFGALAVEMEGAAVAQICYQRAVPCVVIRSISDNANSGARGDSMMFHMVAANNSATLVVELVGLLQQEGVAKGQ